MNCSKCSTELKSGDNFCPVCGAKQEKTPLTQVQGESDSLAVVVDAQPEVPKKSSNIWTIIIAMVIAVVALAIWASSARNSQTSSQEQSAESTSETVEQAPPPPPPPWYPDGYQELTSNLAYQSLPVDQMNCGYSSAHSCYQIYVVSNATCSAFVTVNFLVNGVIIDDAIDSSSITSGGQALLSFVSFDAAQYDGDKKVQITEASCY